MPRASTSTNWWRPRDEYGEAFVRHLDFDAHSPRELHELDVDVLVPGARTGIYDAALAAGVQARVVAPAANVPYTTKGSTCCGASGVVALPDFVCNGGAVLAYQAPRRADRPTRSWPWSSALIGDRIEAARLSKIDPIPLRHHAGRHLPHHLGPGRAPARRPGAGTVSDDLFAAAAVRAPRVPPAAGRPAAPAGRSTTSSARSTSSVRASRCGPSSRRDRLSVGAAVGAARHRQDHAGPGGRRPHREGLRPAVGGHRHGQGRPRDHRGRPLPAGRAGAGHDPVPRRDPPVQQGPAGRAAAGGGGRPRRADRRHHREPVLRGQRPAAVRAPRCSGSSRSRSTPSATCSGTGLEAEGGHGHRRGRSPTWPSGPTATVARPSPRSRSPSRSPRLAATGARPRGRAGRRRGRARHQRPALRRRRPLRRDLGVHQVDPGLRPRRRPVLAGPHGRGGRGRPLHRPPPGDPGLRGRRHGRPDEPAGGRRRRPRRRVRRAPRGRPQPGPGGGPPGHGAQVEPGRR